MKKFKYTEDHEWVRFEGGVATVGISDYAQEQLGDVVYVDLPDIGGILSKGKEAAIVESVKVASEIYAPVSGEIMEINAVLSEKPGLVNEDAEGEGWFIKIKVSNPDELVGLMDSDAYAKFLKHRD